MSDSKPHGPICEHCGAEFEVYAFGGVRDGTFHHQCPRTRREHFAAPTATEHHARLIEARDQARRNAEAKRLMAVAIEAIRQQTAEHIGSSIRLTSDGQIAPEEAAHIERRIHAAAAEAGAKMHPDWFVVVELDVPAGTLTTIARNRVTLEFAPLNDPRVWIR